MTGRLDSKELEAVGLKYWQQYISSPPHKQSYIGGFVVGVLHERHQLDTELADLRARLDAVEATLAEHRSLANGHIRHLRGLLEIAAEEMGPAFDAWEFAGEVRQEIAALPAPADAGKEVTGG